jgi:hypothetical protein
MRFGRAHQEWKERRAAEREENLRQLVQPSKSLHTGTYEGSTSGEAVSKDEPARSEAYRRLVAALPCIRCGKPGPSQCAHANTGKGMGIKASDEDSFPLCPPCHSAFDQGAMFTKEQRREVEQEWIAQTRAEVGAKA